MEPEIPAMDAWETSACFEHFHSKSPMPYGRVEKKSDQEHYKYVSKKKATYDNTNTTPLPLSQTLPHSQSRQLNRMAHIYPHLRVTAIFSIIPEITKSWLKKPGTDAIEIRYIIPLLFTGSKHTIER